MLDQHPILRPLPPDASARASRPPIFVVGFQRSGTTLLQAALGAHPHISAAPEMHFWLRIYGQADYWGDLSDDGLLRRALEGLVDLPLGMADGAEFSLDRLYPAVRRSDRTYRGLLEVVLDDLAERDGKLRWSEKSPGQSAAQVWELFPEAQVIHIVRDPRAAVASALAAPYNVETAWRLARSWRDLTLDNVRAGSARGPAQYMQLRYEDLASDPVAISRLLCAFLDEPFRPEMVTVAGRRSARALLVGAQPWQRRAFDPITPADPGEWTGRMSRAERVMVTGIVAPLLEPLGYPAARRSRAAVGRAMVAPIRAGAATARLPSLAADRLFRSPDARHRSVDSLIEARVSAALGRCEAPEVPPAPRAARPSRAGRMLALAFALPILVALADAIDRRIVLISYLVVGPCIAVLTRRWRLTAAVGTWAVALATVMGVPDGVWGTRAQLVPLATVILGSLATTVAAAALDRDGPVVEPVGDV